MAGFGNTTENDIAKLIYQATAIANLADNAATAPLTNVFVALHTADPGEAGDQTTSEATYTGYARIAVARTSPCREPSRGRTPVLPFRRR